MPRSNGIERQSSTTAKLPTDFYPVCWQDDERMENLFAPFRSKAVNPVNWESKLKFWRHLIKEYCEVKGSAVVSMAELRQAFQRNGQRPHCLDTVIEEQLNDGTLQHKDQFMQPPQHTWSGWAMHKLIKAPLQWSFDRVKERVVPAPKSDTDSTGDHTEYVVMEVVKSQADKLLSTFNSTNDCLTVISVDDLIRQLTEGNDAEFTVDGVETALHYLHCKQKASIQKAKIDQKEIILCKLAVDAKCNVEPITPLDVSIYTLNKMEKSLTKSAETIENDIERTDALVRQYIRDKKRQLAKSFLRKKHVLEKNLAKTSNALTTIQTLLLQIDETKHNAKIVEAFRMGTKTLKNALDDKNITVDNVDDALADVKEILETNADIQFALSGAQFNDILNEGSVDDDTLEAELADLLEDVSVPIADNEQEAVKPDDVATAKPTSPSTITNVIDDLLEERLRKLQMGNSFNVSIGLNGGDSGSAVIPSHQLPDIPENR